MRLMIIINLFQKISELYIESEVETCEETSFKLKIIKIIKCYVQHFQSNLVKKKGVMFTVCQGEIYISIFKCFSWKPYFQFLIPGTCFCAGKGEGFQKQKVLYCFGEVIYFCQFPLLSFFQICILLYELVMIIFISFQ